MGRVFAQIRVTGAEPWFGPAPVKAIVSWVRSAIRSAVLSVAPGRGQGGAPSSCPNQVEWS
jgi:hypothetical protein